MRAQMEKKMSGGMTAERPIVVRPARPLTEEDLQLMRLPERFWHASFDEISEGKHKSVIAAFMRKIHEAMARGFGLLLWGDNSLGKTSAAAVVGKHARRHGYTVLFIRAQELLRADLNRQWFDVARTQTVYDRACSVDVLIIDDMGKEHHAGSGYAAGYAPDMLEDLIRARSSRLRSTIVTSNVSPTKMKESDSMYKKSMLQVMKGSTLPVKVEGEDRRAIESKAMEAMLLDDK